MDKGIILGIIQVRMGSTRLPGKALREINGKPLLWYLYERALASSLLAKVVIATADTEENLPIIEFAKKNNIGYFSGSEQDLVDRLYKTAKKFSADILVRLTGDCPLADPEVVDKITRFYLDNKDNYDYVGNIIKATYPDGLDVDVMPLRTIEKMWNEVRDPFWREWFTRYIIEHPKEFKTANIENGEDLSYLRWTIDYEQDFIFIKEVFSRLYKQKRVFLMKDILKLLKEEPQLCKINKRYIRDAAYYKAKEEAKR